MAVTAMQSQPLPEQSGCSGTDETNPNQYGYDSPYAPLRLVSVIYPFYSLTISLAYHAGTCFSDWTDWKYHTRLLCHGRCKLIPSSVVFLISETPPSFN